MRTQKKLWRNRKARKELARRLQSENPGLEVLHACVPFLECTFDGDRRFDTEFDGAEKIKHISICAAGAYPSSSLIW
jgi:hypothetical protein